MNVALIGAGNLATNLVRALLKAGHKVVQVYSRTEESASRLATMVGAQPTTDITTITNSADVYIISVKDSVISDILPSLCKNREDKVFLHTAGSIAMDVFAGLASHYGVMYPMQTFSKEREVNFLEIPCFIEANDDTAMAFIRSLATSLSDRVILLSSEQRRFLHLAAVFACNFANHCYAVSADILKEHSIPFDVMLPLIDETARKVHSLNPVTAQTGPAVRYDENVINKQTDMLSDSPLYRHIYEAISTSIHHTAQRKEQRQ